MKKPAIGLLLALFCASALQGQEPAPQPKDAAAAREETLARTASFLGGLASIDEKAFCSMKFAVYFERKRIGSASFSVSKGDQENAAFYAVAFDGAISAEGLVIKDSIAARLKPDLSPVSLKASRTQVMDGKEEKEEFDVVFGDEIAISGGGKDPVALKRPERLTAGFPSFFVIAKTFDSAKAAEYLFNAVNYRKREIVEYSGAIDLKKAVKKGVDGNAMEVLVVSFKESGKEDALSFWTDGKGGILGFEMAGMIFLPGNPDEMPAELPADAGDGKSPEAGQPAPDQPATGPKDTVVECLRGVYSADRKALEGVLDFDAMYRKALGEPAPRKEHVDKFKEAVLASFCKKNPKALEALEAAAKSMVEEIAGDEASVKFEGKAIAGLHKKDGKWLIYWIRP